jgi:AcrR family transcriptional regulator
LNNVDAANINSHVVIVNIRCYILDMAETKRGRSGGSSPYHHGDLRKALIEASMRSIEAEGAAALSLRGVARSAGVSHAAPYRHFADKEALLGAVAEEGFVRLAETIARAVARARRPTDRLVAAGVAYVEFARCQPACFAVMFRSGRVHTGAARDASNVAYEGLLALIEAAQSAGELPKGGTPDMARSAWAMVHGIAELAVAGRMGSAGQRELARITRYATRALIAGLVSG